ncbi:MAG: hypothetical protein WCG63_07920 [Opitutaceae bacterium]|jgi:hypothetical protein
MNPTIYHIFHISSLLVLFGYTFYAFAAPAESKRRVMMITGIASLIALVGGFGLLAKLHLGFPGWIIVKFICWLGLSAISGFAYRKREQSCVLMMLALILAITAVVMVYVRPF